MLRRWHQLKKPIKTFSQFVHHAQLCGQFSFARSIKSTIMPRQTSPRTQIECVHHKHWASSAQFKGTKLPICDPKTSEKLRWQWKILIFERRNGCFSIVTLVFRGVVMVLVWCSIWPDEFRPLMERSGQPENPAPVEYGSVFCPCCLQGLTQARWLAEFVKNEP